MIELEFHIPLSPEVTWEHLTQGSHISSWWGEAVVLEPFPQGKFAEQWADITGHVRDIKGSITAFEPPHRLQLDFKQADWEKSTRVEILLSREDLGTKLYLQHSGWDLIGEEVSRSKEVNAHIEKWEELFKSFIRHCT